MNHRGMRMSLMSRELIADSIELVMRGHAYDALVGFAGCDKTLPGDHDGDGPAELPSVFMYGGAMLPGRVRRSARQHRHRLRGSRRSLRRDRQAEEP